MFIDSLLILIGIKEIGIIYQKIVCTSICKLLLYPAFSRYFVLFTDMIMYCKLKGNNSSGGTLELPKNDALEVYFFLNINMREQLYKHPRP